MSLADKRALLEQRRGELSAIRVAKEAALQGQSDALAEAAMDAELARLDAEKVVAVAELEAVGGDGSVEAALAAMNAAAGDKDDVTVDNDSSESDVVDDKADIDSAEDDIVDAEESEPVKPVNGILEPPLVTNGEEK